MSLKHLTIGALLAVCGIVTQAAAQKNELTGILGRTFIADQGTKSPPNFPPKLTFGKGITFEINYAHRFIHTDLYSVAVEVPFVMNVDEDIHTASSVTPAQFSSFFVTPAARANLFPGQAVTPWVSFGAGFGHFGNSSTLQFGGKYTGPGGTTVGVLQAGVGLDVKIIGNFRLRGEARDFLSGEPNLNVSTGKNWQHNIFVGGGVVWQF